MFLMLSTNKVFHKSVIGISSVPGLVDPDSLHTLTYLPSPAFTDTSKYIQCCHIPGSHREIWHAPTTNYISLQALFLGTESHDRKRCTYRAHTAAKSFIVHPTGYYSAVTSCRLYSLYYTVCNLSVPQFEYSCGHWSGFYTFSLGENIIEQQPGKLRTKQGLIRESPYHCTWSGRE